MVLLWKWCGLAGADDVVERFEAAYPHAPDDPYLAGYVQAIIDDARLTRTLAWAAPEAPRASYCRREIDLPRPHRGPGVRRHAISLTRSAKEQFPT